jgi:hypothetical protein
VPPTLGADRASFGQYCPINNALPRWGLGSMPDRRERFAGSSVLWARLVSNQRPLACEARVLPLVSYLGVPANTQFLRLNPPLSSLSDIAVDYRGFCSIWAAEPVRCPIVGSHLSAWQAEGVLDLRGRPPTGQPVEPTRAPRPCSSASASRSAKRLGQLAVHPAGVAQTPSWKRWPGRSHAGSSAGSSGSELRHQSIGPPSESPGPGSGPKSTPSSRSGRDQLNTS